MSKLKDVNIHKGDAQLLFNSSYGCMTFSESTERIIEEIRIIERYKKTLNRDKIINELLEDE